LAKTPPSSFANLWRPEFKGRIVLPEISHSIGPYIIPIGPMAAGKSPNDEATGFEMLKKMVGQQPMWLRYGFHHEFAAN
jgi:putative spermidine/putrescine transport system substrate-binding protein